jgi:dimethylglycine dehydrogenase
MAVSYSGELAYEIHVPNASLYAAYDSLRDAGAAFGLTQFGARAVESMRMEKGFLHWKSELLTEFDPFETNLGRFVRMDKGDFIGRDALRDRIARGPRKQLVCLRVESDVAPAHAGASLWHKNEVVGTVTSGEFGHRVAMNLAMGFVRPDVAIPGKTLELDMLGDKASATVIEASPFDPTHARLRG